MQPPREADPDTGLIQAYLLRNNTAPHRLDAADVRACNTADGSIWVHMDLTVHSAAAWLAHAAELPPAERTNKRLYVLALVSAIFLPLTLVAGMPGMNVAGAPLAASPEGFWILIIALLATAAIGAALARRKDWIEATHTQTNKPLTPRSAPVP